MSSLYPGAVDSFSTKVDNVDKYMAAHMNDVQSAIVAVQGELGVNPAGPSLTVAALLESLVTGWVPESDTWVYVAADQFKIVGKDVTARFPVGVKLKCTNGGSTKYFYGITAVMSGSDTLVTITGGSDYSLSSGAITGAYYSYVSSPQGFPIVFNYSPTLTNATIGNGTIIGTFYMIGKSVKMRVKWSLGSTSAVSGNIYVSIPITASLTFDGVGNARARDAGTAHFPGSVYLVSTANIIIVAVAGNFWNATTPMAWTTSDEMHISFEYTI